MAATAVLSPMPPETMMKGISFPQDLTMSNADPDATVLSVRTTCTNRDLPARLPFGNQDSDFEMEGAAAMKRIVALRKPTAPVRPALGKGVLWRLVSHLSLNYLSLTNDIEGLRALREILRLYSYLDDASIGQQIAGIREMRCRPVVRRVGMDAWRGFCRGTEVELLFDEELYVGSSAFLFGSVLNRFFALYASVNSFTKLVYRTKQRGAEVKRWPPRAGEQAVV